ncbi:MAG: response regulator [Deltaproteobacteria bacterium]|nr:response regulator [Deltaproteobacteria bacterium]
MAGSGTVRASRRALLAAVASIAVAVVAATAFLYRSMWRDGRERAGATLDAVASLKVTFLTAWRAENQRDAATAAGFPSVVALAQAYARGKPETAPRAHVAEVLAQLAATQGHHQATVVGGDGREILTWSATPGRADPVDPALFLRAQSQGATSSLLPTPDRSHMMIQVAAPVDGPAPRLVVVLCTDMVRLYDQAIHAWPVPSRSGETGLVHRMGDQAFIFGGPGIFPEGKNYRLVPMTGTRLPAVQALQGRRGVIEGVDSMGHPVLAAVRSVPDSDWVLVSKMDLEEIDAPLRRPFFVILGLLAALLGGGGVFLWVWWRHEAERARVDEALRESREVFQLALAGSHVVWDWDVDAGRLRFERQWSEDSSAGAPRSFQGSLDALCDQLVHPDDREATRARVEAHLRGETPRLAVEFRSSQGGEGPERWYFVRGSGSRRDASGRAHRLTGVVSDVTARREMQAQLERAERLASVGSLAAAVAHEINNPLAYVLANLGFLSSRVTSEQMPDEAEALADARDGAERVRDVVRGLRTFSRPGAGPRAAVDVVAEVTAAMRIAQNEIRHRARLVQRIGPMPQVLAGPHELGQLFVNLLVNAAHAIPPGRAQENTITVEADTDDQSGWARVEVRDTGVGMAPHVLRRLFDPFFTTKPEGKGMGLGMVIARGIVDGAGGRIQVESEVGRGTVVRVLLPPAPQAPQEAGAAAAAAEPPARRRVLLVDDDPLVARSVVRALGGAHDVVATHSGAEALARLDAGERFDAVLCDVMMPEMTGAQLYARVEARDPQLARRFVFLTGGAFTEEAMEFLQRVAGPCLDKPFDAEQLRRALDWAARNKPDVHVPRMTPRPWRPEKPVA